MGRNRWWLGWLLWLPLLASAQEPVRPANPLRVDIEGVGTGVVVSDQGVALFSGDSLQRQWRVLDGQSVFEPVANGRSILVGSSRGIYAINPADGSFRWHYPVSTTAVYSPLLVESMAVAGATDGILRAVDVGTGRLLWQRSFPGWIYTPAPLGDLLVSGGSHGVLWALDHEGKSRWQFDLDEDELVFGPVAVNESLLIATTFSGRVVALDEQGNLQWELRLATPVKRIDFREDQLLLHRFGGSLSQVDAYRGELLADYPLQGGITHLSSWHGGRWWVSDSEGHVETLNKQGDMHSIGALQRQVVAGPIVWNQRVMLPVRRGRELEFVTLADPSAL
ncbi:PQQ-binding-like beta-propeller repeat protein [Aestuariirhabdus sp. LZHN29]|uniref:outer membrane protein assembly factor BamB family protein n=1 Tax=Aestuariirhabdus sp. LZHN29 TaxID=3417462 RepID=UPI003CF178B6